MLVAYPTRWSTIASRGRNPSGSSPRYPPPGSRTVQLGVTRQKLSQRPRHACPTRPRSNTTWSTPARIRSLLSESPAWPAPITATSTTSLISTPGRRSAPGRGSLAGRLHRAHDLEVVAVGIRERGDLALWVLSGVVRRHHHGRAGRLEPFELARDVGRLHVPDDPTGRRVLALDLIVRADGEPAGADLPALEVASLPPGLVEQLGVVVGEPLRILRADQDAVEVHASSFRDRVEAMLLIRLDRGSRDEAGVPERSPERHRVFRGRRRLLVDDGDLDLADLGVDLGQGRVLQGGPDPVPHVVERERVGRHARAVASLPIDQELR